jgi:hypothetical protein
MRKAQQNRSLISAWFDFLDPDEAPVAQALHKTIRAAVVDLSETIRQGNLMLSLNGEPLLAISPVRGQVNLLIYNGSDIEPDHGPLRDAGRRQRLLAFENAASVDIDRVERIALASAAVARRRQADGARDDR